MAILIPDLATAEAVIRQMKGCLQLRRYGRISRNEFLARWSILRKRLALTDGYRDFVRRVAERANGRCQCGNKSCNRRGKVVHHKKPVARYPALALVVENGIWVSRQCHRDIDPMLRDDG